MRFSLILIAMVIATGLAGAAPRIDRDVQSFLGGSSLGGAQSLPVLITYKSKVMIPNRPYHPKFHAEIERAMIQNTLRQEQEMFRNSLHGVPAGKMTFWIANGTVAQLRREQIKTLMVNNNIDTITYSRKQIRLVRPGINLGSWVTGNFTYGLEKVGVPELRQKYPQFDGSGVTVGILDTGIDPTHPDLTGKVKTFKDFTAAHSTTPSDEHGHGTHVAGTIAGGNASGTAIGVAPKASLVIGKIFDGNGSTTNEAIMAAMQWIADPDGNPNTNDFPRLVSNSWGDSGPNGSTDPQDDPLCVVLENWVKLGMLPVFAAGNEGPYASTVGSPGACPMALTVGATDSTDHAASFSSRGPVKWKSGPLLKPNVAAPGVNIQSAKPGGDYQMMSGTSMATPHVSGVMAVLFQVNPNMTVDQAVKAVEAGAKDLGSPGADTVFGSGRVDVFKSTEAIKQGFIR